MQNKSQPYFHLIIIIFFLFTTINTAQVFRWTKQAGGTSEDLGASISTNASGYSYVIGWFNGTATFGSIQLTSNGLYDIFIAKYNTNGNCVWAKNAGGTDYDRGWGISTDANGNCYVTGNFEGTATFGTIQLVSNGGDDIFIAKYDVNGNCVWARNAGGTNTDYGNSISTDANGNCYVTGFFVGTATFGTTQLVSNGDQDIFIAKYDQNGNFIWVEQAGGTSIDGCSGISTDANGNCYVTGNYQGTATFGTNQLVSNGGADIFIAKYDASGNCIWAKSAGGNDWDNGRGISIDTDGNPYVTGGFAGTATFGTNQLVSNGGADIFITKYDASGNCVWAKSAGGNDWDDGVGISTDANGNCYVTGDFEGTATFGTIQLVSNGWIDIFIAKYDADGSCIWAKSAGGTDYDMGEGISTDADGNCYVTGCFAGTATFGTNQLISNGGLDIFISKILNSDVFNNRIEFYTNVGYNIDNPNNYISPGYHIRFRLRIKNGLTTNILTAYGTIRCLTAGITVTDSLATYNNVFAGQDAWSIDDYEIYIPNTMELGSEIEFLLIVTQAIPPTGPWNSGFSFPIAPLRVAQIYLDDDQNPDSWGNNNKIPEPGETIEVVPLLKNVSSDIIYFTSGKLSENLSGITVWNNVMGVSGMVYDTWRYNLISGVPQPIPPGVAGIQPEQDYVFDYGNIAPYPSLPFNIYYNAYLEGNPGVSWDTNGVLIKWENPFLMADGVVLSLEEFGNSDFTPSSAQLYQNFPNPFNPSTTIQYRIIEKSLVTLNIYDVLGNEIATLVDEYKPAGSYKVEFNSHSGLSGIRELSSGIYFYKLQTGSFVETKKMILLK